MVLFNTFTRKKEEFIPLEPPYVRMYNCGPTVYDTFHIGNARNFVVVDVIRRYLMYKGYKVKFVQNITDIDDKIIARAQQEGASTEEIARRYTEYYFKYINLLGIMPADENPRATEFIPQMIEFVQKLVQKNSAYVVDGDVFFRIKSYPHYGELSGKKLDDLKKGARVDVDPRKEDPLDFALWKSAKPGEPYWESPWGKGRPGWHIECSVMSMAHLGETLDIHSGGIDLIFPHHENERAQSESLTNKQFVRYWLHNGFLNIESQKMSKSLGNILTIDSILEQYDPEVVRYFLISAHYRHPLDYSQTNLREAKSAWQRLVDSTITTDEIIRLLLKDGSIRESDIAQMNETIEQRLSTFRSQFEQAMDDDFNTAEAIAALFNIVGEINTLRENINQQLKNGHSPEPGKVSYLSALNKLLKELIGVLGFRLPEKPTLSSELTDNLIRILVDIRQKARQQKLFEFADMIRSRLNELGIVLEDHPQGTIWKFKQ
ncbi:cysteine--tRNA ligase [Candidatus Sumerlaeota bacterium]|nr:cysteine--tRNA ligase [Candidatus Sumerlaeota bacterium]